MRGKILALMALAAICGPLTASAVPVKYDLTFTATTGPDGTGSLFYDADVGVMTDFFWDFAGTTGGWDDAFGTTDTYGGTFGQFMFEILSQTDVHPSNCVGGNCYVYGGLSTGTGPLGAPYLRINSTPGGPTYLFSNDFDGTQPVATGSIGFAVAVPEPALMTLFGGALLLFGFMRRRAIR